MLASRMSASDEPIFMTVIIGSPHLATTLVTTKIARKNFLFSFIKNGADSSATYFSIQQTARANGYDPGEFTEMLLTKLRYSSAEQEIDALMPWNLGK